MSESNLKLDHDLQAIPAIDEESQDFFSEASPLFAGSVFCLIREDPEKLAKEPTQPKVVHTTALSEEARLEYQRAGYGIFFTVNAFRDGKRDAAHLDALKALYVDVDAPKALKAPEALLTHDGRQKLLEWKRSAFSALTDIAHEARKTFPYTPTLVVETKNGFHAYWYFESFIPFSNAEEDKKESDQDEAAQPEEDPVTRLYARTIQQLIKLYGADSGAKDISRVLRSPYSWHLKNGKADPFPCRPVFFDPSSRAELEDYASCFKQEAIPEESNLTTNESLASHFVRAFKPQEELSSADKAEIDAEVLAKFPKSDRPSIRGLMNPTGIPEGSRNASLFCVVSALREDGHPRSQVESELLATGYNGLSQAEILSVIASAYKTIHPRSFGWNDPIASAYRTPEEEAQVKALYREAINNKLKAKNQPKEPKEPKEPASQQNSEEAPAAKTPSILPTPLLDSRGTGQLLPAAQKQIYNTVENLLAELLPDIKYLEGLGWHRKEQGIYQPINSDDLAQKVSTCFRNLGLTNYQTNTGLKAKFAAWSSLPNASVERSKIEPGVGTSKSLNDLDVLPLANGILNLRDLTIRAYRDDEAWRFTSPILYEPGATCPRWLSFIDQITENDLLKAKQLQEIAGYCLTSSTAHQLGFVLLGEGSNGKSVYASIIAHILGPRLQSSITMETLQSNFGVGNIEGKRLNVVNEISEHYLRGDIFKRLIDGSEIMVDKKNAEHRTIKPFSKFLFTVNRLPQVDEASQAIFRRLMVIKLNRIFRGAEVNHNLEHELKTEASGILNWCLGGLVRLRTERQFTQTEEQRKAMEEFKENSSHLISFLRERFDPIEPFEISYQTSPIKLSFFCDKFSEYCAQNNYRKMGTKRVSTDLVSLVKAGNLPGKFKHVYHETNGDVIGLKFKS